MKSTSKNLVLITRPVADAERLAQDIEVLGLGVMIEPMLGIVPLNYDMPNLSESGGLIFTSANAVRIFGCPKNHRDIPVFAVGNHTAEEACKVGYVRIFSADGDAQDLVALIKKKSVSGKKLWHLRGQHIAAPLEDILKADKIDIEPLAVYMAKTEDQFTASCLKAIKQGDITFITFFSKRTAENFIRLADKEKILDCLTGIKALCLSPAVLECVQAAPWAGAYSAESPDRHAMLTLLRTVCNLTK